MQLGKRDRLAVGILQALQQPLLLSVNKQHRRILGARWVAGASGVSQPRRCLRAYGDPSV
jgi:hypothetical protein